MDYYNTWGISNCHSDKGKQQVHEARLSRSSSSKKSKNKKLSTDPQSVAARKRRHRITNNFKILKSLIPGGSKMDTASMLDEAIKYVKFLKTQIYLHQLLIDYHYGPLPGTLPDHVNDNTNIFDHMGVHDEEHSIMSQVYCENCYFEDEEQMMYNDL